MAIRADDVEHLIRTELVRHWDANQLEKEDARFSAYIRFDALRVAHILNLLPKEKPFCVLEVGVGSGDVVAPIAHFFPNAKIFAVEAPGRDYLKLTSFHTMLKDSRTTLEVCDITNSPLPYGDNSFDFITLSEVVEHLPPQAIPHVLRELHRILVPHGQLIVTTPNVLRLRNRLRFLAGKNIFDSPAQTIGGTFGHLREYSQTELFDMIHSANFDFVEPIFYDVRFPISETVLEKAISKGGAILGLLSARFQDFICLKATK
jgi:SAM-dependent methyltransferase